MTATPAQPLRVKKEITGPGPSTHLDLRMERGMQSTPLLDDRQAEMAATAHRPAANSDPGTLTHRQTNNRKRLRLYLRHHSSRATRSKSMGSAQRTPKMAQAYPAAYPASPLQALTAHRLLTLHHPSIGSINHTLAGHPITRRIRFHHRSISIQHTQMASLIQPSNYLPCIQDTQHQQINSPTTPCLLPRPCQSTNGIPWSEMPGSRASRRRSPATTLLRSWTEARWRTLLAGTAMGRG